MLLKTILTVKGLLFCVVAVALLALFSSVKLFFPLEYERYSYGMIGSAAALLATVIFLRFEKKNFSDIGLVADRKTPIRFLIGFVIGILITSVMVGIIVLFGGLKLQLNPNYSLSTFFFRVFALIPLAYMEEVIFRGYSLRRLTEGTGIWPAQIILAILFALYHTIGGGQSVVSALTGPGLWAFLYGAAALRSGGIAVPTGLHFAANFVLVAVGEKREFPSIWTIEFERIGTSSSQAQAEQAAMIAQVFVFVLGLAATFWVVRSQNKTTKVSDSPL